MTVKEEMKLKTDIQIAQEAQMLPIREVAERAGIAEEDLEFYGKYDDTGLYLSSEESEEE